MLVFAFAVVVMADAPLRVGEVESGPVVIAESTSDRTVAVKCDRMTDPHVLHGAADLSGLSSNGTPVCARR